MHPSLGRRMLIGAVVAVAAAALAAPAYAAAPAIRVALPDVTVAAGGSTQVAPILFSDQETTVTGATAVYQLSGDLDGVSLGMADEFSDCTSDGPAKLTCTTPWETWISPDGAIGDFVVGITATNAALGKNGTVKVTFSADGVAPITRTADVTVAEGVDLAAGAPKEISVKPGRSFEAALQVHNTTDKVVHGTAVIFDTDYPFLSTKQFANCFYSQSQVNACTFDQDLEPGATYQIVLPYRLRADTYAPGTVAGEFEWLTAGDYADLIKFLDDAGYEGPGTVGSGGTLEIRKLPAASSLARQQQTDTNPDNNWQSLTINVAGKQGTDFAAIGATVSGGAGDNVKVPVGVRNNGPATLDRSRSGSSAVAAIITIPTGTTVTTVADGCSKSEDDSVKTKPDALQYVCFSNPLFPAKTQLIWEFGLKITKVVPNAVGAVEVNPACECDRFSRDINKSNDAAKIVVNPADTGGSGGSLPITGPQTGFIGAAGALLLAAGIAGFIVARRRRTRFVA
ncbi:LPXTG cell wall anchor domain-containing protein [Actinoplanes sp. NPDC049599]|uniref:LPXTG cell wall anchor domain-containing protein n=1 Tax=Actinoplanes sp. NPDC049599 TaxID=3363903 RepID=UPI003797856A